MADQDSPAVSERDALRAAFHEAQARELAAVQELDEARAECDALRAAMHRISLCSQSSISTIRECGKIARAALKEVK